MGMKYIIYEIAPLDKSILYSYIGSTKNFRRRKFEHKSVCENENSKKYNFPLYKFIRENGGWDSCELNPIEEIEVETKTQARIREQFWKENRETKFQVLNAVNPYTNRTEYQNKYREENKEELQKYQKIYRDENKQQINQKKKQKHTCPCGGHFTTTSKARHFKTLKHIAFVEACLTSPTL
jgi:hypothetical protein